MIAAQPNLSPTLPHGVLKSHFLYTRRLDMSWGRINYTYGAGRPFVLSLKYKVIGCESLDIVAWVAFGARLEYSIIWWTLPYFTIRRPLFDSDGGRRGEGQYEYNTSMAQCSANVLC